MPDEIAVKSGFETSEYKLTKTALVVFDCLTAAGVILESLAQSGIGAKWVGVALVVVGAISRIMTQVMYNRARLSLKTAAMDSAVQQGETAARTINTLDDVAKSLEAAAKNLVKE